MNPVPDPTPSPPTARPFLPRGRHLIPLLLALAGWGTLPLPPTLPAARAGEGEKVEVGRFSQGSLEGWETKEFKGETRYRLVPGPDGRTVLEADSQGTASGLVRKLEVDLTRTPCLNWSWKIAAPLQGVDETTKGGDDYPARIYVIHSGGVAFWATRALNYVWSSHRPLESPWDNAFTSNATMVAVDSGPARVGQWVHHHRDLRADFRRFMGLEPGQVDAVALMSDTDNSGQSAHAQYGDISFTAQCP